MTNHKLTLPLVALMLALAALVAPAQADKPANGAATCSAETAQDGASDDDDDNVFCQVIASPANVNFKSAAGPSLVAICHMLQPNTPLACGNSSGSVAGFGGAIYHVGTTTTGNHQLSAWVKQSAGLCGIQGIACGFDINLCNDVDLDGTCTNINDNSDQFQHAQSNEPILGGGFIIPAIGDLPCVPIVTCPDNPVIPTPGGVCNDDGDGGSEGDKGDDKDTKNCGTDDDASASFCGKPAEEDVNPDDWSDGQVVTFIGAWIDTWIGWYGFGGDDDGDEGDDDFPTNIGAGLSIGTFDAWLTVGASCTLPECDDDLDNDDPDNGAIDYPDDPGCDSWKDPDEAPPGGTAPPECNDGADNDGDGLTDELDPDCYDFTGPGGTPVYDPNNQETTDNTPDLPECSDGEDNDDWEDYIADYPWDPGCEDSSDDDEANIGLPFPECSDHFDNDANGPMDWPSDPGCSSPTDDDEWSPECSNLKDDDGNGVFDGNDPGCSGAADNDESSPQCSDLMDNDGDGVFDGNDPGCSGAADNDEADAVPCGASSVQVEGTPSKHGATYDATVVIRFTLGAGRTLTTESVTQTGGPDGGYWYHTHPGGQHVWETHGPDYQTRQFTYSFGTSCSSGGTESFGGSYWQWN